MTVNVKHGHTRHYKKSRTYESWRNMKKRCYYPGHHNYKRYGERGITVCDRWKNSFILFLADMGERPEGMTLDRINPNLGYFPENCQWATPKQQANNRRTKWPPIPRRIASNQSS